MDDYMTMDQIRELAAQAKAEKDAQNAVQVQEREEARAKALYKAKTQTVVQIERALKQIGINLRIRVADIQGDDPDTLYYEFQPGIRFWLARYRGIEGRTSPGGLTLVGCSIYRGGMEYRLTSLTTLGKLLEDHAALLEKAAEIGEQIAPVQEPDPNDTLEDPARAKRRQELEASEPIPLDPFVIFDTDTGHGVKIEVTRHHFRIYLFRYGTESPPPEVRFVLVSREDADTLITLLEFPGEEELSHAILGAGPLVILYTHQGPYTAIRKGVGLPEQQHRIRLVWVFSDESIGQEFSTDIPAHFCAALRMGIDYLEQRFAWEMQVREAKITELLGDY